jgi:hypothetical protein
VSDGTTTIVCSSSLSRSIERQSGTSFSCSASNRIWTSSRMTGIARDYRPLPSSTGPQQRLTLQL